MQDPGSRGASHAFNEVVLERICRIASRHPKLGDVPVILKVALSNLGLFSRLSASVLDAKYAKCASFRLRRFFLWEYRAQQDGMGVPIWHGRAESQSLRRLAVTILLPAHYRRNQASYRWELDFAPKSDFLFQAFPVPKSSSRQRKEH